MIEQFFLGLPFNFHDICTIYPLKVKDIVQNPDVFKYISLFLISQEDIEDSYTEKELSLDDMLTPFEQLLNMAYNDEDFRLDIEKGFELLTHEKVTFLFKIKKILFGSLNEELLTQINSLEELRFLDEKNYFEFQNVVRVLRGIEPVQPYVFEENAKIRSMKAKARYRDKVKAKQEEGLKLESVLESVCCMQIGINPLNIGELSYTALVALLKRFQEVQKFDIDLHSIWAGADPKKNNITPKNWIRNLE